MKVLFAVSSESISDAIIKKYQREYKEILSYKNVYYFNAILKEIQKDKTYDRIVISEDLEPFSNNNYDTIDKFIFEKLDNISDEAQDSEGKETSIILICTDRHTKSSSFLVKIFGIGVYNALLGNDRSMEEVCKLIKRPRVKKEAKMYYKIDSDDVSYDPKSEKEVSELEIQNILAHFKKIARNKEKYADSFNNIASQYTDEQLKIIVNCLPISVKAVLEEECPKYQEMMAINGNMMRFSNANSQIQRDQEKSGIKIDLIQKKLNQPQMSGPIVIPSSVKKIKTTSPNVNIISKQETVQRINKIQNPVQNANKFVERKNTNNNISTQNNNLTPSMFLNNQDANVQKEKINEANNDINSLISNSNNSLEKKEDLSIQFTEKKGRGRPKKINLEENLQEKPKGKRGRPKKINSEETDNEEDDDDSLILNFDNEELDDDILPGLDEESDDNILPGLEDEESDDILPKLDEEESDDDILPGLDEGELDEGESDDNILPGLEDEESEEDLNPNFIEDEEGDYTEEVSLPGIDELDDLEDDDANLPELDYEDIDEDDYLLPGVQNQTDKNLEDDSLLLDFDDDNDINLNQNNYQSNNFNVSTSQNIEEQEPILNNTYNSYNNQTTSIESIKPQVDYSMSSLNSLLTKDKKIVTFLGTTKNGTSFLINNLAALFSSLGINTAILDMTQNRNSYYIYTKNEEELRKIAYTSVEKLQNGFAEGIKVDKNLTVYTSLPNDGKDYSNAEPILSTLVQNHSLILIDCDFETDPSYFASCQEIYLVQSMDILTIQPLTSFLRDLKAKGVLESEKVRVVINKEIKVRTLTSKIIIGGMSFYNDPSMSFMTELFNKDIVKACSIPFEDNAYSKYLDSMVNCNVSLNGYSKAFLSKLRILGDMVYPLTSKQTYAKPTQNYNKNAFSSSVNNTLNQMKNKY